MGWERNLAKFTEKQGEKYLLKKAKEVRDQASINAPVRTGALRDSIKVVPISKRKVKIGSDLPYSWFVEMGTSKMSPRAYLRAALRRIIK